MKHPLTAVAALLLGAALATPTLAATATAPMRHLAHARTATKHVALRHMPRMRIAHHQTRRTRSNSRIAATHRLQAPTANTAATSGVGSSTPPAMNGTMGSSDTGPKNNLTIPPATAAPNAGGNTTTGNNTAH